MIKVRVKVEGGNLAEEIAKNAQTTDKLVDKLHSEAMDAALQALNNATSRFRRSLNFTKEGSNGSYNIHTYDRRYTFLNSGVRPQVKTASPGKLMVFPWAASRRRGLYQAKSRPGKLAPGGDGSYKGGTRTVGFKSVNHPGSKPREYDRLARALVLRKIRGKYKNL